MTTFEHSTDDRTGGAIDLVCGGFPCQDISLAGFGAGLDGNRSGLWFEMERIIRESRPRYVVIENVAALLHRGMDRVLAGLAGLGFDAEWSIVSACSLGAPHMRRRLFIVAYPNGEHGSQGFWNTAARSEWALQAGDRFKSSRADFRTRLANPSELYGGANGLPKGLDRNRGIGNAVVPIVVESIGKAIMSTAGRAP